MIILVFLENLFQTRHFLKRYQQWSQPASSFTVISTDRKSQRLLKKSNIHFKQVEDFDLSDKYGDVSDRAYYLAEHWVQDELFRKHDLSYKGIFVPALIEWEATYFFLWVLKSIIFVRELIDLTKPDQIWGGADFNESPVYCLTGIEETSYGRIGADLSKEFSITFLNFGRQSFEPFKWLIKITSAFPESRFREKIIRLHSTNMESIAVSLLADVLSFVGRFVFDIFYFIFLKKPEVDKQTVLISSDYSRVRHVIKKLKELGSYRILFFRKTFSIKQAISFSRQHIYYRCPSSKKNSSQKLVLDRLRKFWDLESVKLLSGELYEFRGYHFGHLIRSKFRFIFCRYFPTLVDNIESFYDFLKQEKVSRIVVEEDVCTFNKTLIRVANQMSIPSIVIQHGFSRDRIGFLPMSATYFAAWGECTKNRLVKWGAEPERIVITGNGIHDDLLKTSATRREFLTKCGLDPAKRTVLLAMFPYRDYIMADFPEVQYYVYHYEQFLLEVASAVNELEDVQLIVKLHPRDRGIKRCLKMVTKIKTSGVAVIYDVSAFQCIQSCDCIVTGISTVAIDALPFKKPIVILDTFKNPSYTKDIISLDVPVIPIDRHAIVRELKNMLILDHAAIGADEINFHLSSGDGHSTDRIVRVIDKLNSQPSERVHSS